MNAGIRGVTGVARPRGNELAGTLSTGRKQRRRRWPSIQQTCTSYRLVQVRCRCGGRDGLQRRRCVHRLLARGRNEEKEVRQIAERQSPSGPALNLCTATSESQRRHLPFHNDDDDEDFARDDIPVQSNPVAFARSSHSSHSSLVVPLRVLVRRLCTGR